MMKTAITITARMKSTRLPLKVLRLINNNPLLEHLINRLKKSELADMIILCTSTNPGDEILTDYAQKLSINSFRGDEDDVLKRLYDAAVANSIDFIVSTTADNPLTDPNYIDKIFRRFKDTNADYITIQNLPLGTFSYGVKITALKHVIKHKKETDTEIWGSYFANSPTFKKEIIMAETTLNHPEYRLTVDTPEDFALIREIYKQLQSKEEIFSLNDVITLLSNNPNLLNINKNSVQKRGPEIHFSD